MEARVMQDLAGDRFLLAWSFQDLHERDGEGEGEKSSATVMRESIEIIRGVLRVMHSISGQSARMFLSSSPMRTLLERFLRCMLRNWTAMQRLGGSLGMAC